MDEVKIITGDHAEINAVKTRGQEKRSVRDALPKKAQELFDIEIKRYDGRCSKEAEKWLKAIDDWIIRNDLRRTEAFDLLLSEEAAILWKNYKSEDTLENEAREWFLDTFTIKRTILDKIKDLAAIRQEDNERFATFEIRVLKIVEEVLNSGLSKEEMVSEIITNRVRDVRLKEALTTKPTMTHKERNELAKIYEKTESVDRTEEILTVKPILYAEKCKEGLRRREEFSGNNQRPYNRQEPRRFDHNIERRRFEQPEIQNYQVQQSGERKIPTVSLKHIAKRVYNRHMGFADPKPCELRSGQCFCCGEEGHRRFECPLKDKCLICGKNGHNFRNCSLLNGRREYNNNVKKISCVHEEMENQQVYSYDDRDEYSSDCQQHEVEVRKNVSDPIAHISSLGSQI